MKIRRPKINPHFGTDKNGDVTCVVLKLHDFRKLMDFVEDLEDVILYQSYKIKEKKK